MTIKTSRSNMTTQEAKDEIERLASPHFADNQPHVIEDAIAAVLGVTTPCGREALKVALTDVIALDKRVDITPDTVKAFGLFGIVVHMNESFERLKRAFKGRRRKASLEADLRSITVYSLVATLLDKGLWPKD